MFEEKLACNQGSFRASLGYQHCQKKIQDQIPLILDDHVVKNHTSSHDVSEIFLDPNRVGPRTLMGNLACKAPKALSISFRHASCAFANSTWIVFTNVSQDG
jgi:hypothetical protein